jgi:NodT family efflux transporter outer membrane factor (OMF) lipoprotein
MRTPRAGCRDLGVGASLLLLLLAGCATAPPPSRLDLSIDLPDRFTAAPDDEEGGAAEPVKGAWWSTFGDDRLDRLVQRALENNHDLSAAAARLEAAGAQARIAGADLLPEASLEFTPGRRRQNFIGFPIPGGGGVLSTTTTTYGASLNVSWEVDLWGRLRAREAAALADVEASRTDLEGARLSLAGQTAKAWFALVEAIQQVELARETLDNRRLTRRRIARRYELGLRPALELRFAMSAEASSEASLAARQRQLDAARRQIDLLLSRYPEGVIEEATADLSLPELPDPVPPGLPADLVTRRPDLVAAERRLAAAGLTIKEARAALYPRFRLTGSAGRLSGELEQLSKGDFSVWSIAGSLLQPLFLGGRLRAGVTLAEARYREQAESYVQRALEAFAEVETALAAEKYLRAQERALSEAAKHSIAARELAEDRYDAGLVDYLSVLEAQREATVARSLLLDARRQLITTRIDLHLSLGGGFETAGGTPGSVEEDASEIAEARNADVATTGGRE